MQGMRYCGIDYVSVQDMMQAKNNTKNRVRRRLNDPKKRPCRKTLRRATNKRRTKERTVRKRGTLMIRGSGKDITNAGKSKSRPCVEKKKMKRKYIQDRALAFFPLMA